MMLRAAAAWILTVALGAERGQAVLDDLEEELARERRHPGWSTGAWLFWQAVLHAIAARSDAARGGTAVRSERASGREACRSLLHDVRIGFRSLRSAPAFTMVSLGVLAVGIGATTTVFAVVDAVVLRGLPFPEGDRLVQVTTRDTVTGQHAVFSTPQDFLDWRAGTPGAFDSIVALRVTDSRYTLTDGSLSAPSKRLRICSRCSGSHRSSGRRSRPITRRMVVIAWRC